MIVSEPFKWEFNHAPLPDDPSLYMEDSMVTLLRPKEEKVEEDAEDKEKEEERRGPKPTDWRHGPAEYW